MEDYSSNEFLQAKGRILDKLRISSVHPVPHPHAYLIVGQPGAGKTTMANLFTTRMNQNIIFISGDDYRKFHPHYTELQKKFHDEAVLHTQKFSGEMTEAIIEDLSNQKYNLIIEGTLRTAKVPAKTKSLLHRKGYETTLAAILVRPEISYLSTLKRYQMMKELGTIPRQTPKEHHDLVVSSIVTNIDVLHSMKVFNDIQIYNRKGELLYSSIQTPKINPTQIFRNEFERKLSPAEQVAIINDYCNYVDKDKIQSIINDYEKQRTSSHEVTHLQRG